MARRLIDLSQEIYDGQPVFIGHPPVRVEVYMTHEQSRQLGTFLGGFSWTAQYLQMSEHGPTHVDAISHVDPRPDALTIEQIPLEWFLTPALCIDFTDVPPRTSIPLAEVQRRIAAAGLDVRRGDTFLMHTGHYRRTHPTAAYCTEYAGLAGEAAEWLYGEMGVINIGADAPSIDNAADRTFPCHMVCRKYGTLNTENLGDLSPVAGKRFTYIGFPLRIRRGSGSPIRAVALLEE